MRGFIWVAESEGMTGSKGIPLLPGFFCPFAIKAQREKWAKLIVFRI